MSIGKPLATTQAGQRDAFHVAAIAVTVQQRIEPGTSVRFTDDALTNVVGCAAKDRHGVVDPFLAAGAVPVGVVVWVLLEPWLVTGLTHNFSVRLPNSLDDDPVDDALAAHEDSTDEDDRTWCRETCGD